MTSWNVEFNDKMIPIDKNSFSFTTEGDVVAFDFAYITIHGAPPGKMGNCKVTSICLASPPTPIVACLHQR